MTAIVLPDIDRSTVDELRKKIPNLTEIEMPALPSMEKVGKNADLAIDRLLGRSRAPVWPWIAAGIGLIAVIGALAAYFAWFRRPTWESPSDAWTTADPASDPSRTATDDVIDRPAASGSPVAAGKSLSSNPYPIEEA